MKARQALAFAAATLFLAASPTTVLAQVGLTAEGLSNGIDELNKEKQQGAGQQPGRDPNACGGRISLLGVVSDMGPKMSQAMLDARAVLTKTYEAMTQNTKGADGKNVVAPEGQESDAQANIGAAEHDIADLRRQSDEIMNQISDQDKTLNQELQDYKSGKMVKDIEEAYKDTAVPTDFNKMAKDNMDADQKYHDEEVARLKQTFDELNNKMAARQKAMDSAQQKEQEIMKKLGPLRAKYKEQNQLFEAAMRAAKC